MDRFIEVYSKLEDQVRRLRLAAPELYAAFKPLASCKDDLPRLIKLAKHYARRVEITFILQEHGFVTNRLTKTAKRSQAQVYREVRKGQYDLVGLEGYAMDEDFGHMLEFAALTKAKQRKAVKAKACRLAFDERRHIARAMRDDGALRACSTRLGNTKTMGIELTEAEEFKHALFDALANNKAIRRSNEAFEEFTLLMNTFIAARAIFATALMIIVAGRNKRSKPALVMGVNHRGEFLILSLLWGFRARMIDTTLD